MNRKLALTFIIAFLIILPMEKTFSQEVGVGGGAAAPAAAGTTAAGTTAATGTGAGTSDMDIVAVLNQLVPQPPGSSITLLPGQNQLIVRNTPSNLKKIDEFLKDLTVPPQVAIEAKFIIVGEKTFRDLGLEWGDVTPLSFSWANPVGRDERYSGIAGTAWSYDTISGSITSGVSAPTGSSTGGLQLTYQAFNYPQLQATLRMLSTRADTKFLSAPTVTTLNNEPADVRFVTTVRYVDSVDVSSAATEGTTTTTATTTTTYDWTFIDRDVGIVLYVSPTVIRPTQSVRLFLQPVVSEMQAGTTSYIISQITGQAPITITPPTFTSRDATTNVNVHDGTTIVLGGLMNEATTELISKVPFLGDIPIIGKAFFQEKINSVDRQHLLIFITVHVLDSQGNPFFAKS